MPCDESSLVLTELLARAEKLIHAAPPSDDLAHRSARFDEGLAFVANRPAFGGSSAPPECQAAVDDFFVAAGAAEWRDQNIIGLGMAAPTIYAHGTEKQLALLRPLFVGQHIWCQLFSEPDAGSDLASVATSATRAGKDWIVNGQKVWTSLAHTARYGLLLARTDPSVPKHRGLTYFLFDMTLDGVDVRPLRQLTGEAEFNEVHLTGVRVPDSARIGAVGDGWKVAMSTLVSERNFLGGGSSFEPIDQALEVWQNADLPDAEAAHLTDRLVALWCESTAVQLLRNQPDAAAAAGSVLKLRMAELNQRTYDFCLDVMGPEGVTFDSYEMVIPERAFVRGDADPRRGFLRTLANSVEGGTSEIQRNVIGERILGLPAEPRIDKDLPWNEVPRST